MTRDSSRDSAAGDLRAGGSGIVQVVDLEAAEHSWEVRGGVVVHGYAFNSQVPGPTIEAAVGDTLLVRFSNLTPKPIAIDWHGLPEPMNGAKEQAADPAPAGGVVEYRFQLPRSGTFWYHPQDAPTDQAEPHGLYGVLLVRGPAEPGLDGDRVLVIAEMQSAWLAPPPTPAPIGHGADGDLLLVNGVSHPQMEMAAGETERWRLINATEGHDLWLSLDGRPFALMTNQTGLLASSIEVHEVLMRPAEHLELVVGPFAAEETVLLDALSDRGKETSASQHRLATFQIGRPGRQGVPPSPASTPSPSLRFDSERGLP
jgi:FtsP/CotA-like multicopper oxidase with cupredoxin domain